MNETKYIDGELGPMEIVITNDGSTTVKSSFYNEACHSLDGAKAETIYNFIEGCEIEEKKLNHDPLVIFETGLGLGYGLDCTLEAINGHPLLFISTEIEPKLIDYNINNKDHDLWRGLEKDNNQNFISTSNNQTLIILAGNATIKINKLKEYLNHQLINAIYQDAFSPKKNPELWTEQWFKTLKDNAHIDCKISTYCASRGPREAMQAAGWQIHDRKGFGRKKLSTIATIKSL